MLPRVVLPCIASPDFIERPAAQAQAQATDAHDAIADLQAHGLLARWKPPPKPAPVPSVRGQGEMHGDGESCDARASKAHMFDCDPPPYVQDVPKISVPKNITAYHVGSRGDTELSTSSTDTTSPASSMPRHSTTYAAYADNARLPDSVAQTAVSYAQW